MRDVTTAVQYLHRQIHETHESKSRDFRCKAASEQSLMEGSLAQDTMLWQKMKGCRRGFLMH